MTARIYIRVSTGLQAEHGFSLAAQQAKAEAWCQYQGITEQQLYPDAGVSGQRDDRPALKQLLRDLQPGDVVVVYALSRLGRGGAVQMLGIIGQIREAGARLVSLTEHIDTETSAGRLMLTILAALAELELEQTRERTDAGRTEAARQGIYPHSSESLPTGWQRGPDGRIIEDSYADTVRWIFAQGTQPYERTAKALNAQGRPGPKGGRWEVVQVRRIIKFEGYHTGQLLYRQSTSDNPADWIAIPAPALISCEQWQAAQRDGRVNNRHRTPEKFPLTGHLRCVCGARLMGRDQTNPSTPPTHNRRKCYTCYARVRKTPTCPSNGRATRNWYTAESLLEQARLTLARYLSDPSDPARLHVQAAQVTVDPYAAERADIERRLSSLVQMHLDQAIEYPDYLALRQQLIERREALPGAEPPAPEPLPEMGHLVPAIMQAPPAEFADLLDILDVEFAMQEDGTLRLTHLTPLEV